MRALRIYRRRYISHTPSRSCSGNRRLNKRVTKASCATRIVHLDSLTFECADASKHKLKSQGLEKHAGLCDDSHPCVEPERVNARRQY